ncbi:hypothetical protein [Methylobacterium sp. CM6257]
MTIRRAFIYSVGVTCPAGHTFADTMAAYVNGDTCFVKDLGAVSSDGSPPTVARVYPLADVRDYSRRMQGLLRSAHDDCLSKISLLQTIKRFPLLLVLPPWMRGHPVAHGLSSLADKNPLDRVSSLRIFYGEHAESLYAIQLGCMDIEENRSGGIFVAAVDSHLHPSRLDRLAVQQQLLTRHTPYGFIPGEGAVVLFLCEHKLARFLRPLGRLQGVGWFNALKTPRTSSTPEAIRGRSLATAYQQALTCLPDTSTLGRLIVDLNGDRGRAEEFGFAISASGPRLAGFAGDPEAPATCLGDLGAATGLTMAALALGPQPVRRGRTEIEPARPTRPPLLRQVSFLSASSPTSGCCCAALLESPRTPMPDAVR